MAVTQYYVDPSIAAASGAGTIGDPYGDLQHALDTITRGADGDQINIKAGTDEILSAKLTLATYGTPDPDQPLILRGYTSAANDGGIGGIDCNGDKLFTVNTYDYLILWDLEIHNGGSGNIVHVDDHNALINCTIHNTSASGIVIDQFALVIGCTLYDIGGNAVRMPNTGLAAFNYIYQGGTNDISNCFSITAQSHIIHNIINIDSSTNGIASTGNGPALIMNNTIYANAGTGTGISIGTDDNQWTIINNYIEGFSGAGGKAISTNATAHLRAIINNYYYNNTTDEDLNGVAAQHSGNTSLSASGLVDPANDDFRARPNIRNGVWPATFPTIDLTRYTNLGALQRQEHLRLPRIFNPSA